jgi:hypothetical protein
LCELFVDKTDLSSEALELGTEVGHLGGVDGFDPFDQVLDEVKAVGKSLSFGSSVFRSDGEIVLGKKEVCT